MYISWLLGLPPVLLQAVTAAALLCTSYLSLRLMSLGMSPGIIPLQLAFTPRRARVILEQWQAPGIALAQANLRLDFLFIVAYAPALAGLVVLATRSATPGWHAPGAVLALLMLLAGALDAVENLCLLRVLARWSPSSAAGPQALSAPLLLTAGLTASVKFVLLGIGLLFIVLLTAIPFHGGRPAS